MKLNAAKTTRIIKPFYEDDKIAISVEAKKERIVQFHGHAKYKNMKQSFPVKFFKGAYLVKDAWVRLEKFFADLK